jgi:hypothetical protein
MFASIDPMHLLAAGVGSFFEVELEFDLITWAFLGRVCYSRLGMS